MAIVAYCIQRIDHNHLIQFITQCLIMSSIIHWNTQHYSYSYVAMPTWWHTMNFSFDFWIFICTENQFVDKLVYNKVVSSMYVCATVKGKYKVVTTLISVICSWLYKIMHALLIWKVCGLVGSTCTAYIILQSFSVLIQYHSIT